MSDKFIIGLDFDGVCTYFPRFLSWLSKQKNIEIHIITGKREKTRKEIEYMLEKLKIKYASLNCIPTQHLATEQEIGIHKKELCKRLNIDIFIDDNSTICELLGCDVIILQRK